MKNILSLLLFFFTVTITKAQSEIKPNTLSNDSALHIFKELYPQEKVFVQSDKDFYISGETIWMKIWTVLETAPTFLSKVVYVDLVDNTGQVALKKMYRLDSVSSTGADFELPKSIKTGNYSINAYTLWMLNFPEYIFQKNVFIYGTDLYSNTYQKKVLAPAINFQFFPEGGDLISGVTNRLAFKATNEAGVPVMVKGQIIDKNGKIITDFFSEHDGMGVTVFTVDEENEYTAVVTGYGKKTIEKLPKAKTEGIALKVENTNPNRIFVLLNRTEKGKEKFKNVKVVATINYQIVFSKMLDLDKGETAITINKKNLPAGLLQVTLFDSNNLPLAERIAFVENYTLSTPAITLETKNLLSKGKNTVSFNLDAAQSPSLSCLVTIYLPGDSTTGLAENIATSLLLTSDLKGYIHNPGLYFKDKKASTLHHLDLLLMTQGWRRFSWTKLQQNQYPPLKYAVESALSFRGTVYKTDSKEKIKNGKVSFIFKGVDSTTILAEAKVTDKGEFLLNNINYLKSAEVAYMGTNLEKEKYIVDVKLLPNYIDSLQVSPYKPSVNLDTVNITQQKSALAQYFNKELTELEKEVRSKTLENVVIKAKKTSPVDSLNNTYAEGPFLMGKGINPLDFKNYQTIWQMIQTAVPGVNVEGNPFDPTVKFSRFAALGSGASSANASESSDGELSQSIVMETNGIAYFLNEVNVSKDIINTLLVDDIALIKVLKNEALALGASQGAIVIYTKQNVTQRNSVYDKAYKKEILQGYAISKEFYQPENSTEVIKKENENRFLLYWNSKLRPAKDGKFRFQFENNSHGIKARIVIQGIDQDGTLIYKEQIIE